MEERTCERYLLFDVVCCGQRKTVLKNQNTMSFCSVQDSYLLAKCWAQPWQNFLKRNNDNTDIKSQNFTTCLNLKKRHSTHWPYTLYLLLIVSGSNKQNNKTSVTQVFHTLSAANNMHGKKKQ